MAARVAERHRAARDGVAERIGKGVKNRPWASGCVSENGPREGTRDLPKRDREAGYRAVESGTPAGKAYAALNQASRRRRAEILDLVRQDLPDPRIAELYQKAHPLEPVVTTDEIRAVSRRR